MTDDDNELTAENLRLPAQFPAGQSKTQRQDKVKAQLPDWFPRTAPDKPANRVADTHCAGYLGQCVFRQRAGERPACLH